MEVDLQASHDVGHEDPVAGRGGGRRERHRQTLTDIQTLRQTRDTMRFSLARSADDSAMSPVRDVASSCRGVDQRSGR